jgi:glycosyltransferase involved in cell wall biosynthesis
MTPCFTALLIFFQVIILLNSLFNFFTLRSLSSSDFSRFPKNEHLHQPENLAVIIPMRNEEHNVNILIPLLTALKEQWHNTGRHLEIVVINDQSEDGTGLELEKYRERIEIVEGKTLPDGWLGKNWANYQGVVHLQNKYSISNSPDEVMPTHLLFIDADIQFVGDPIIAAVAMLKELGLDYLSAYPRQIAQTWSEKLLQPLLQWSWCSTLPIRAVEKSSRTSTVVANGQFFLISLSAYFRLGGHKSIAASVLDDMDLAKAVITSGGHGTVIDGSDVISCRMYTDFKSLFHGYTKSLWNAFPSTGAIVGIFIWLLGSSIFPFLLLFSHPIAALTLIISLWFSRYLIAICTHSSLISPLFHPFAVCVLLAAIVASHWGHRRGTLSWKGRMV